MSCWGVKVSCTSFKWCTFVLLFLPLIFCTMFQTLFIGVWQFSSETGSAPNLLQCSSSFRSEDADISEVVRCRMFSELSFDLFTIFDGVFAIIIKPWFTWVFGFVEVFAIVSSAIDINVSLSFKIRSVAFRIFPFDVFLCTYVRTDSNQLCQICTVLIYLLQ